MATNWFASPRSEAIAPPEEIPASCMISSQNTVSSASSTTTPILETNSAFERARQTAL